MTTLRNLQKYAINKDFFEAFYRPPTNDVKKQPSLIKKPTNTVVKSNVSPSCNSFNSLFWAFYALIKNEHELSMQETHRFKLKNQFALKFVETLKKNKPFIKENKLKFHDIESSILYDKDISLMTLKALVLLNKLNVIYIWNSKYYVFQSNDDDLFQVIERNREKFIFDRDMSKESILQGKAHKKLLMEDVRTQLKSMSTYKLDQLQTIATMFGIPIETTHKKKKTKQLLYEEINSKID